MWNSQDKVLMIHKASPGGASEFLWNFMQASFYSNQWNPVKLGLQPG